MRRLLVIATTILVTLVGAPAIATAQPAPYVALGDSYSSGLGTGSYTLSSSCKRGTRAYPYLLRSGVATNFVACQGYNIAEVRRDQLAATAQAGLVTLTVGGNDIGFSTVVTNCTAFTSDAACTTAVRNARELIPTMRGHLTTLLRDIRSNVQNGATIVLLGYPHLYATGPTCGFGQPNRLKRQAMYDGGQELNAALEGAVRDTGDLNTRWVDVRPIFTGHDICATSSARWINGLVLFNSAESYHPNSTGHRMGYLRALQNAGVG